jgi:hypothetical protein
MIDLYDHLDKYDLPDIVRHWTREGVFQIQADIVAGSICFNLFIEDELIGTFNSPKQAARELAAGALDYELTFSTSGLGIPSDFLKWNNLS